MIVMIQEFATYAQEALSWLDRVADKLSNFSSQPKAVRQDLITALVKHLEAAESAGHVRIPCIIMTSLSCTLNLVARMLICMHHNS